MSEPVLISLDVRDVDEWIGGSSSPCGKDYAPRKGRIPGAKWRRGTRCVPRSGTMRRLGLTTVQPSMGQTGWSAAAPES
jgi:3-mercaptopyruvate sulfurtransferase SseA